MDNRERSVALLLVALAVVAHGPAVGGGFLWDDDDYVSRNETLTDLRGLGRIWFELGAVPQYYPLTFTTYWLEYRLWGLDPRGFHLTNVLLHALGAVLLWRVLRVLAPPLAVAAAAVFAVHPVHVESVAWITERKNTLSGALYLAAALAYLRFDAAPPGRRQRAYLLSLSLYLGALLSKTVVATLPFALVLVLTWKRGLPSRRQALPLLPFLVLGVAFGMLTAATERFHVGAEGADWSLSGLERVLIAGRALWFYAGKILLPVRLSFVYPRWEIDATVAWQYLYPAAAVAVPMALWMLRRRLGRGPLAAVLFFAGTLAPALGFIDIYPMRFTFVADHYQYLASIGLIALAVASARRIVEAHFPRPAIPHRALLAMMLAALIGTSWHAGRKYADSETLWRDTIRKNASCWLAYSNLAKILNDREQYGDAESTAREAIRLKPDHALAHNSLGVSLARQGRLEGAIDAFRTAVSVGPNHVSARNNLASLLREAGRYDEAADHLKVALEVDPESGLTHFNLGLLALDLGDPDLAARHLQMALRLDPDLGRARELLEKVRSAP